jgi:C4-dicarboxylate-binding protein DctP
LSLFIVGSSANAAITIRVTLQLPQESLLYENLKQFKDRVEKETNGEITVELFPSSKLFKASEVRTAVASGAVEMGASLLSEYIDVVPAVGILSVPFLFSHEEVAKVAMAATSPIRISLDKEILAQTNTRVLWWVPYGSYTLVSKKEAIGSPARLAGKRIRVDGKSQGEFIALCGGTPVIAPGPEQYGLLKSGDVDGTAVGLDIIVTRKLWEVADTLALTRHIQQAWPILINEKLWQSLTPEQQLIVQNAANEAEKAALTALANVEKEAVARLEANGMKVIEVTSKDVNEWKLCSSNIPEHFLNLSGKIGQELIESYGKILVDSLSTHPQ